MVFFETPMGIPARSDAALNLLAGADNMRNGWDILKGKEFYHIDLRTVIPTEFITKDS